MKELGSHIGCFYVYFHMQEVSTFLHFQVSQPENEEYEK